MASGADPPDAVDKDNPTSHQADLAVLARARIDIIEVYLQYTFSSIQATC